MKTRTSFGNSWPGKRCGAYSRRRGGPCPQPAMLNGRCRFHGGKCTGPKTPEGKLRSDMAHYVHGKRTKLAEAVRRQRIAEQRRAKEALGQANPRGGGQRAVARSPSKPCAASSTED